MNSESLNRINRLVVDAKKWVKTSSNSLLWHAEDLIQKSLRDDNLHNLEFAATGVDFLAIYHGGMGVASLINKDHHGWQSVHLSVSLYQWSLHARQLLWHHLADAHDLTFRLTRAAGVLSYAIARNHEPWKSSMISLIQEALAIPDMEDTIGKRVVEPFLVQLASKTDRSNTPMSDDFVPSVYSRILSNWADNDCVTRHLHEALDFHCLHMIEDQDSGEFPGFEITPFDFIPWEILAILETRRRCGFEPMHIEHPLFSTEYLEQCNVALQLEVPHLSSIRKVFGYFLDKYE